MKKDNNAHVIVCRAHGSLTAYPCTLDGAIRLLASHRDNLYEEAKALAAVLAEKSDTRPYSADLVLKALAQLYSAKPADALPVLRVLQYGGAPRTGPDERPPVLATVEIQEELALWLFRHKVNLNHASDFAENIEKLNPLGTLSFLAPAAARLQAQGKVLRFVRGDDLEVARELVVLERNRWMESTLESAVVTRCLTFINDHLTHRDVKYEVVPLETEL